MNDNKFFNVDTYYLGHPDVKVNKATEVSLMFNRTKPQLMYGIESIIEEELCTPRTSEDLLRAGKSAREWNLDYPIEFFEPVITEYNGYLPLKIKGLVSGEYAPKNTPFLSITNTVNGMGPIVPWCESMLMMAWFDTACLSRSYEMAQYLKSKNLPAQRIHAFDLRSHRSKEDMKKAGTAWFLGGLKGSDTFPIAQYIQGKDIGSIPAMAHTLVQNFGMSKELESYKKFIDIQIQKGYKTIAIVIDTYSSDNFIKKHLDSLMNMAHESGITIVYRPDSGNVLEFAKWIYEKAKNQQRLNCTKVIIGENVTFEKIKEWDDIFEISGIPLNFISYGIGSGVHQDLSRDTHGWAMKTCYVANWANNRGMSERIPVMKFSDTPIKMSIPGPVDLIRKDNKMIVSLLEEYESNSCYTTLYEHDPTYMSKPYINKPSLNQIMKTIQKQNTSQKEILYSDKLIKLKEQLINDWRSNNNG